MGIFVRTSSRKTQDQPETIPFLPIVEWRKKAEEELHETANRRQAAIDEFLEQASQITEFKPYLNRQFVLGFLRTRKYHMKAALISYKKFFGIRLLDPTKYLPVGQGTRELETLFALGSLTLLKKRNPIDQTMVILARVGGWTPESGFDFSDAFTPLAIMLLAYGMDDATQVHGVRFLLDLRGLHMGHLKFFPIKAVRACLEVIKGSFPVRFKGFHILQDSFFFNCLYTIVRPFMSRKIQKRILFHGTDIPSLYEYICQSVLPKEYGGFEPSFSWHYFVEPLRKSHSKVVDFSFYGYTKPAK